MILLGAALLTCYVIIWLTYGLRFDAAPYPRGQLPSLIAAAKKPWLEQIVRFISDYLFFPDSCIFGIADAFRALVLLALWTLGSTLAVHPDYLAFFNEAVAGPDNGHKILVDSNLDWGQDLKGLKAWMERNKVEKIQLAYFGTANPIYYGIDAD